MITMQRNGTPLPAPGSLTSACSPNVNPYIAMPPRAIRTFGELKRIASVFIQIVRDPLIPRNSEPCRFLEPPEHIGELPDSQLAQCIRIYDNVETTRKNLE